MPHKLDDQKKIATDDSGKPIWITEGGGEKSVDYPGFLILKRLSANWRRLFIYNQPEMIRAESRAFGREFSAYNEIAFFGAILDSLRAMT